MSASTRRARVTLEPRRLWRLRLALGATRWVLYAVAAAGVAATVHNAVAPPARRTIVEVDRPSSDADSQWLALSFARAYLTWSTDSQSRELALAAFLPGSVDPSAGLTPAPESSEVVDWLAVAGERDGASGERDYTVAAATSSGVRYLAVAVGPAPDGGERVVRYPALVAAPVPGRGDGFSGSALPTVTQPAVVAVLDRALRNYVDGSSENLAADLAPGAVVVPPAPGLAERAVQRIALEPSGLVLATVIAADPGGSVFTLAYEVGIAAVDGRWEITRIEP